MEDFYLFEFQCHDLIITAAVHMDETNQAKHTPINTEVASFQYRRIHGTTPHAYLLANTDCGDRVELASVVGFDFGSCSIEEIDCFLTALINKVDNDMLVPIDSIGDFVKFIESNTPN